MSARPCLAELISPAREGNQLAIARLLTQVETSLEDAADVMDKVAGLPRNGRVIGFIGPPGVGKSSLVSRVVEALVAGDRRVAVIAEDPTGARTGGALLGDRIRMKTLSRDPRVFIRSAAARDPLRSLSATTFGSVGLLARIGFDYVLVEAVGGGQSDVGTSFVADTTVLVLAPGLGDDVQAMKAGVMEVADVIVVNKSDLPNAREAAMVLRQAVKSIAREDGWVAPVVTASAEAGDGIDGLLKQVEAHGKSGAHGDDARNAPEVVADLVLFEVARRLRAGLPASEAFRTQLAAVRGGTKGTIRAALDLADELVRVA